MTRSRRPLFLVCRTILQSVLTSAALVPLILAAPPPTLAAQVLYGSIVGNVTDAGGGRVPGATVVVSHSETGASHEAVSDSDGAYRFSTLQPGPYKMTVKLTGFRTFSREIPVTPNNVTRVDAALQVGQLSETVTVAAETPLLQTDRAEVRAELKARELVNLPVALNRNYQYLF